MDIKKLKLAIEQAQKVCTEMNKCANKFILQDSINEMNQALTIPVVVVPKGTLVCEHRWIHNTHTDTKYCSKGCDGFKIQEAN